MGASLGSGLARMGPLQPTTIRLSDEQRDA